MQLRSFSEALPDLNGCTLIIPAVSIGNVGQLALDLLIETFQAPRIGRFTDSSLLPCVGRGSYSHVPGIAYSMELFSLPSSNNTYLVQQRGPAAPGLQQAFADSFVAWATSESAGVKQIYILGSLDGSFRRDDQLQGTQLRYYSSDRDMTEFEVECDAFGIPHLEEEFFSLDVPLEKRSTPPWPIVRACSGRIPCSVLLSFVLEGDNVPDAVQLAHAALMTILKNETVAAVSSWKHPPSWDYAFGNVANNKRPVGM